MVCVPACFESVFQVLLEVVNWLLLGYSYQLHDFLAVIIRLQTAARRCVRLNLSSCPIVLFRLELYQSLLLSVIGEIGKDRGKGLGKSL